MQLLKKFISEIMTGAIQSIEQFYKNHSESLDDLIVIGKMEA